MHDHPFVKLCSGNFDEGYICFHSSLPKIILNLDGHEAVNLPYLWKGTSVYNIFCNVFAVIMLSEPLVVHLGSLLTAYQFLLLQMYFAQ